MKQQWFVGIDISKATLDAALCESNRPEQFVHHSFDNTSLGFRNLRTWLRKHGVTPTNSFVGMEHTGHYTLALCCFLQENDMLYTLISPLQLKKSLGLTRGKNDKVDAQRIAQFTCLHQRLLKPMRLPSACLLKLKNLMAFRERLVKTSTSLQKTIQDLKDSAHLVDNQFIIKESGKQLQLIEKQIKHTDSELEVTLQQDEQVWKHFQLVKSVVGIGLVTATALVIHTQNFTAFESGRQFACYAGVAPFEHCSGSSVRGRPCVSPLANRRMKALWSNCASAAVQHDPQLKGYYQRKVSEGKAKMTVLNAVKAKLINRVFAIVNRGTAYVPMTPYSQAI